MAVTKVQMTLTKPVTFVTGNSKKLEEVKMILGQAIPFQSLKLDLPELQGEPEDISKEKARLAAKEEDVFLLWVDLDRRTGASGRHLSMLSRFEWPTWKWFLAKTGHEGLNNLLTAYDDKSAYALCVFSLALGPDSEPITFSGRTEGKIVPARGSGNFGWDPIFQPVGYDLTFAEMPKEEKNRISHRRRALDKVKEYFYDYNYAPRLGNVPDTSIDTA